MTRHDMKHEHMPSHVTCGMTYHPIHTVSDAGVTHVHAATQLVSNTYIAITHVTMSRMLQSVRVCRVYVFAVTDIYLDSKQRHDQRQCQHTLSDAAHHCECVGILHTHTHMDTCTHEARRRQQANTDCTAGQAVHIIAYRKLPWCARTHAVVCCTYRNQEVERDEDDAYTSQDRRGT